MVSASSAITLTVGVAAAAVPGVTNTVTVSTSGDTNTANNSSSNPTTVNGVPDLSISKTHSGNFTVGVNGAYTISVQNVGSGATTATITVTDTLPTGLGFVSGTGTGWSCSAVGQTVTCTNAGPIAASASSAITLTVSVAASAAPSATNNVTVSTSGDTNAGNNSANDPTTVTPSADVRITLQTNLASCSVPCNSVTFSITVNNAGPSTATGVTLTDTLPLDPAGSGATIATFIALGSSSSCVSSGGGKTVTCSLGNLASAASVVINIAMSIDDTAQGRNITNNANVSSTTSDPDSTDNAPPGSTMQVFPFTVDADLALSVSSNSPASGNTTQLFTYVFSVINNGPSSVQNVSFALPLASGANTISGSFTGSDGTSGGCSVSGTTVNCSLGTMKRAITRTITVTTKFSSTGAKSSTGTVSAGAQTGCLSGSPCSANDPSANNTASVTSTVTP